MGKITHSRYEQLVEMGREPITLPYEIFFNGNKTLQKTHGSHHLGQYRNTGTYFHPSLVAQRKREALDYAKRLLNGSMSAVTLRKIGGASAINEMLAEFNLSVDEEQMEIINMNADFLSSEYDARKSVEVAQRAAEGKVEVIAEPETPNKEQALIRAAATAITIELRPEDNLASGDEDDKVVKIRSMKMNELQQELKDRGIKQEFGQTKDQKQELLLKNL